MTRRMFTAVVAAVAAFALTACGSAGDADTLRVGTLSDSKPNAYQENGEFTGFDNELLKAIAEKQGLKLEFVATDFSALLGQVANGTFDIGSSAISQTDERKKTVAFSDPYNFQSLGIAAPEGSAITARTHWRASGSASSRARSRTRGCPTPPPTHTRAVPERRGRPVGVEDRGGRRCGVRPGHGKCLRGAEPRPSEGGGVDRHGPPPRLRVQKGNTELRDKVNAGLQQVVDDGTWQQLHKRFEPDAPTPPEFAAPGKS